MKKSRAGRWRAGVLIAVHLAIAAHIGFWLASGRKPTLSPVEPSEGGQALANGVINTGLIFFLLAIFSTLILGRWFCGWACHVVALQDLCGWTMKKMGVRPKPFRSRLLLWAPLAYGLYLFVGEGFKREVFVPFAKWAGWWPRLEPYFVEQVGSVFPHPQLWGAGAAGQFFRVELLKAEFWETFPSEWYIIVPFLGICGFATVYFLGAKGFCTYGCPYGGFFAPIDKLSPMRIRVTDACHHCGHCTAACSSNVRVHEEVRDYGMIVDPGCMKCMDCVSVCPNDALYFGIGKPAVFARPRTEEARKKKRFKKRVYDLSWGEEIALALVFVGFVVAFRGFVNSVPMLMAMGIAGVGTFLTWTLWRMVREQSVRIQNVQLKYKGRIRVAGIVYGLIAIGAVSTGVWAGIVRYSMYEGEASDRRLSKPLAYETVFVAGYTPDAKVADEARRAARLITRGSGTEAGGIGWTRPADKAIEIERRLAWLSAVTGDRAAAVRHAERGIAIADARPQAYKNPAVDVSDLVGVLGTLWGLEGKDPAAFMSEVDRLANRHESVFELQMMLAQAKAQSGDQAGAAGAAERGVKAIARLVEMHPGQPRLRSGQGQALASVGRLDEAIEAFNAAAAMEPTNPAHAAALSQLLRAVGREQEAAEWQGVHDRLTQDRNKAGR